MKESYILNDLKILRNPADLRKKIIKCVSNNDRDLTRLNLSNNDFSRRDLFLMSASTIEEGYRQSGSHHLYLYEDKGNDCFFYISGKEKYFLKDDVKAVLRKANFNQPSNNPTACEIEEIRNTVLNIASKRGHIYPEDKFGYSLYCYGEMKTEKAKWIKELCNALKNNDKVTTLHLRHCQLGTAGGKMVQALSDTLKSNTTITELNLAANNLFRYEDSDVWLGEALGINKSIKYLDLSDNHITNEIIEVLSKSLKGNHFLKKLIIGTHAMTEIGLEVLRKLQKEKSNLIIEINRPNERQSEVIKSKRSTDSVVNQFDKRQKIAKGLTQFNSPITTGATKTIIKSENPISRHPLSREEIRNAAIAIRGNNNDMGNCAKLVPCIIQFLTSGKIEVAEENEASVMDAPHLVQRDIPIKTESQFESTKQSIFISIPRTGLNAYIPPSATPTIEVKDNKLIHNLQKLILDVDQTEHEPTRCRFDVLKDILLRKAEETGGVIFGEILLSRCNEYQCYPGHKFAYYAVSTDNRHEIIFIDAQFYNGETRQGEPLFLELTDRYLFADSAKEPGISIDGNIFGDICAYTIYSTVQISNEASRALSSQHR